MYDLSHVEVARGPQGTLNGRNSTAGAVNLVSAAPNTSKFMGSAGITVGDYRHLQTQGMINIPFSDDMALRIAAIKDSHDGTVDFRRGSNVMPGAAKYGAGDQMACAPRCCGKSRRSCAAPSSPTTSSTRAPATSSWPPNRSPASCARP
jgi:outer membrane receptor protein involved in Fe transport